MCVSDHYCSELTRTVLSAGKPLLVFAQATVPGQRAQGVGAAVPGAIPAGKAGPFV